MGKKRPFPLRYVMNGIHHDLASWMAITIHQAYGSLVDLGWTTHDWLEVAMKWWVLMDWADAHMVTKAVEQPSGNGWVGPFDTFTEMRRVILSSGMIEHDNILNQLRERRSMRKDEVVIV